jgi:feruloyl esterase
VSIVARRVALVNAFPTAPYRCYRLKSTDRAARRRKIGAMRKAFCFVLTAASIGIGFTATARPLYAQGLSCERLVALPMPNGRVTLAETVAAGRFTPPAGWAEARLSAALTVNAPSAFETLPAFCRVAATLTPSTDSDIRIEVWMPLSDWNGNFQAVGNGGYQGLIPYAVPGTIGRGMVDALKRGYATAATDTGHRGNTLASTMGHPEKLIDFGYRAVH